MQRQAFPVALWSHLMDNCFGRNHLSPVLDLCPYVTVCHGIPTFEEELLEFPIALSLGDCLNTTVNCMYWVSSISMLKSRIN